MQLAQFRKQIIQNVYLSPLTNRNSYYLNKIVVANNKIGLILWKATTQLRRLRSKGGAVVKFVSPWEEPHAILSANVASRIFPEYFQKEKVDPDS